MRDSHYTFGMRTKGRLVKGLLVALILSLLPIVAFSAQKIISGSECKVYKQKVSYQNKVYTCIKSRKKLAWSKGLEVGIPTPTFTPAPAVSPAPIAKAGDLKTGLIRADYVGYFEDNLDWFASKTPTSISVESKVDLQTGIGDYFSVQWTGYFIPTETGKWTFNSTSDDGSGVWIGESAIKQIPANVAVLSAPGIHGPYTISKQKYLEKGNLYPIRILFGDKTNWAQMTFSVQPPSATSPIFDLKDLVWHSPISSESNSGIDPQFAKERMLKDSHSNDSQHPVISDSSALDSIESCKLKNSNISGEIGRGFPVSNDRLPTSGNIRGIVLFVDFNDLPGANDTQKRFNDYTEQFKAFYTAQSYGKITINMDYYPKYLHINKSSSAYGMQTHNGGNPWLYIKDALAAADPFVDFSLYDFVVAIPPSDIKTIAYGPAFPLSAQDNQLLTNEKVIKNAAVAGADSINSVAVPNQSFLWLSHEVGHLFGLEHQYTWENVTYSSLLRGIWDLMDTGSSASEFLAWHRFVLGWLDSSTIRCINRDTRIGTESVHFLSPIESQDSQPKAVVIRLNDFEAIVLELRRNLGFDHISEAEEGVLAYKVNVRDIGKAQEVMILTNQAYEKGAIIAGNLTPGDKIIDSSVEITVLKSTIAGDYVKVAILKP